MAVNPIDYAPKTWEEFLAFEKEAGFPSRQIAGVDEVGRGCLAGPVMAGAVILPEVVDPLAEPWLREVTDSKKLSEAKREELAPKIRAWVRDWAVAEASVAEIDQINIHHASHLAMVRAVAGLKSRPDFVLVDGKFVPKAFSTAESRVAHRAVIKGDLRCLSIACASILAKVARDHFMMELENKLPGYGFAAHKGYPTPVHKKALLSLGVSDWHRRSFSLGL